MTSSRPNRLIHETSPYLRQHAYNPVDWYPWGPEALERARREDKPIFLSIGYSTCHWCHVMAHECFENEAIAAFLNEHFISIKVDREERPDLDETYMTVVQLLTGRGGWPMSVFLAPDLKPFFAGTYFPPEDRGGLPGFPKLLQALVQAYRQNRGLVSKMGQDLEAKLKLLAALPGDTRDFTEGNLRLAALRLKRDRDRVHGGFSGAPKFPRALELGFLLHSHHLSRDPEALDMVAHSLEKMARGGIYDQLGGGFHRYAVDERWLVPHFEKMLYDNALLVPLYLAHYQLTGSAFSRRVARETLDFVLRELQAPQGGFYAAWDADSEGEEGKFYLWRLEEIQAALGEEAPLAQAAFGITPEGNFEGKNILTLPLTWEELGQQFGLAPEQAEARIDEVKKRLLALREVRVKPHRDEKIIAAWNGLMLTALAQGAQILGDPRYYEAAARGARFLLDHLWGGGRLRRIWAEGQVRIPAFLDDYAALANACLDLFETDFDPSWIETAKALAAQMEDLFLDPGDGAYFYVGRDQETALVRSKHLHDQAVPAGNSLAARLCWRLWRLTEAPGYEARFKALLRRCRAQALENPWGYAHYLTVAALSLRPPLDITVTGEAAHPRTRELLAEVYARFLPERRLVLVSPQNLSRLGEAVPGIRDFRPGPEPLLHLCHHYTCRPPVSEAEQAARLLEEIRQAGEGLGGAS